MLQHDFPAAIAFLRLLYPRGPWVLTAISVDKLKIESRAFWPDAPTDRPGEADALEWLVLHRQRNLYYSVNEPVESAYEKRKLEKSDVSRVHFLHVDVDPRTPDAGTDPAAHFAREQARIESQILMHPRTPSIVVFSGGGYNALWKLARPMPVAGCALDADSAGVVTAAATSVDEAVRRAEDVERRNWQFELDFNTPDHCRDVSRILRLPGTVNWPGEQKLRKGRTPALAKVVFVDRGSNDEPPVAGTFGGAELRSISALVGHPYEAFLATPVVAANQSSGPARVSENVRRVESLDDPVLMNVPAHLKVVITQGFDPEDKSWSGDRSGVLFHVCCELVRCAVPDEVILGIITDSRFGISASVLDKRSQMRRYALRQISRARDKAHHPKLAEMNEKYAVISDYGGRCVVLIQRPSIHTIVGNATSDTALREAAPAELTFQRKRDFLDAVDHEKIEYTDDSGKRKFKGVGTWWFDQRRRRQYDRVVFEPGLETPGDFNLWRGFAVEPQAGNDHLRYLEHVYENICSRSDAHYDYLIKWMARVVQRPRTQSMTAVVLLSAEKGTGKSTMTTMLAKIFAPHSWIIDSPERLTGQFNAHLADRVLVVAEEAFDLRDRRHEGILKELITGTERSVERKGVDAVRRANYVHLILNSNHDRVVPAGDWERRYFVLTVGIGRLQNHAYFRKINADFCVTDEIGSPLRAGGGAAHLLHHLLSVDLEGFSVAEVPSTKALREQQEHNLSLENEWLLRKLERGHWLAPGQWSTVPKDPLYEDYAQYGKLLGALRVQPYRAWHTWLLRSLGVDPTGNSVVGSRQLEKKHDPARPYVFEFPSLDVCRAAYLRCRGWSSHEWPTDIGTAVRDDSSGQRGSGSGSDTRGGLF